MQVNNGGGSIYSRWRNKYPYPFILKHKAAVFRDRHIAGQIVARLSAGLNSRLLSPCQTISAINTMRVS